MIRFITLSILQKQGIEFVTYSNQIFLIFNVLLTRYVKSDIVKQSEIIKEMIVEDRVGIVSAVYHLDTGIVHFD